MTALPENCPKCQSKEVDTGGKCLVCGYTVEDGGQGPAFHHKREGGSFTGMIEMDYSGPPQTDSSGTPAWRQELSRRLQEIKRKRTGDTTESALVARTLPFLGIEERSAEEPKPAKAATARARPARRAARFSGAGSERRVTPLPEEPSRRQPRLVKRAESTLPLFQRPAAKPGSASEVASQTLRSIPTVKDPDPTEVQQLIDSIVARQAASAGPAPETSAPNFKSDGSQEGKLILLSRTLSGFVDLIIVVLCSGSFIIAADIFSGIDMIDTVSKVYYGALLLVIYLVYSAFFLATANQTIGMMIKDLRIVSMTGGRPHIIPILARCAGYLVSLLGLGIGLLWACFDRQSMCFHDRLSHTRVVRL